MRAIVLCLPMLAACGGVPASNATGGGRAAEARAVAPGADVPFGAFAVACGVEGAALGPQVASASGYAIHDPDPSSTAPRTHYITGFGDGCPRQVTAALALFGDVATHETLRYAVGPGRPSATDAAYEEIKARVCGVAAGQPCGAATARLAADTVFVSLYPAFGSEQSAELLLHAGAVAASDL